MKRSEHHTIRLIATALLLTASIGFAQTSRWILPKTDLTNSIPTNLFPTDEGMLIRFTKSGEAVIDVKKLKEAADLPECHSADQDPEGHWGLATNGFQLSLRFDKAKYVSGEQIEATTLVRNLTEQPQTYYSPLRIIAMKGDKELKRKNSEASINITVSPKRTVYPHTQQKDKSKLNGDYDLTQAGEYTFQAVCKNPEFASQKVSIVITNRP